MTRQHTPVAAAHTYTAPDESTRNLLNQLRADLTASAYTAANVTQALGGADTQQALLTGVTAPAAAALQQAAATAAANSAPTQALTTLCALFQVGAAVRGADLAAALPTLGLAGAVSLGLVAPSAAAPPVSTTAATPPESTTQTQAADDAAPHGAAASNHTPADPAAWFRAALALNPVAVADTFAGEQQWWIISDLDDHLRQHAATAHVAGVGGASRSLLLQAPPRRVQLAADLGTGCGIIALHLALRAEHVIATDISARALRFAAWNAVLNAVTNIEFRQGDLFQPLQGEAVQLLLTNPPFVIEPDGRDKLVYRSSGAGGDSLAETVVTQLATVLAPGGEAVALINWENNWGADFTARPVAWLTAAAATCQALDACWLVERDRLTPLQYAQLWVRDGGLLPSQQPGAAKIMRYLDDFRSRQVASVSFGVLRLRTAATAAAASPPVVQIQQERGAPANDPQLLGAALDAAFDSGVRLARLSDADLLACTLLVGTAVLEQRVHSPGVAEPQQLVLLNSAPYLQQRVTETLLAAAVGACDGELTVGQIVNALAQIFEVSPTAVRDELLPQLRELAWQGFVTVSAPVANA